MVVRDLWVEGYRSIRDLRLTLAPVTVVVGPNGSGKTNLYQALCLLSSAAHGTLARSLADEGGMPSVLWAGPRKRKAAARFLAGVAMDQIAYQLVCGVVPPPQGPFELDPDVKEETVWAVTTDTRHIVAQREGGSAFLRDSEGERTAFPFVLWNGESFLSQLGEPHRFPLLSALRGILLGWRFYHHFRTDADAPMRQLQVGVRTAALANDGRDLAAALMTVQETGDRERLHAAVEHAFPGTRLELWQNRGRFGFRLAMPGLLRPLDAAELSDGTLHYLCLVAALLSPRFPTFLALNEPETGLHLDVLPALAELITDASERGQVLVTTHSETLARTLEDQASASAVRLTTRDGATILAT
ncbi:MAG: AAA family ATPase [Candidatus Limnocylindria bacterium]